MKTKNKKFVICFYLAVAVFICTQAWAINFYVGNMPATAKVSEPTLMFLSGVSLIGLAKIGRKLQVSEPKKTPTKKL